MNVNDAQSRPAKSIDAPLASMSGLRRRPLLLSLLKYRSNAKCTMVFMFLRTMWLHCHTRQQFIGARRASDASVLRDRRRQKANTKTDARNMHARAQQRRHAQHPEKKTTARSDNNTTKRHTTHRFETATYVFASLAGVAQHELQVGHARSNGSARREAKLFGQSGVHFVGHPVAN